jgi:hypothetical protein
MFSKDKDHMMKLYLGSRIFLAKNNHIFLISKRTGGGQAKKSVITEKSSATLHTMVEERHQCQQQLVHLQHQNPSKRHKTIHLVQKLKCANSPKEVCALCAECGLTQP